MLLLLKKMSNDTDKTVPSKTGDTSKSALSFRPRALRSIMSGAKFNIWKFGGKVNFGMWQCEVMDVLIRQE